MVRRERYSRNARKLLQDLGDLSECLQCSMLTLQSVERYLREDCRENLLCSTRTALTRCMNNDNCPCTLTGYESVYVPVLMSYNLCLSRFQTRAGLEVDSLYLTNKCAVFRIAWHILSYVICTCIYFWHLVSAQENCQAYPPLKRFMIRVADYMAYWIICWRHKMTEGSIARLKSWSAADGNTQLYVVADGMDFEKEVVRDRNNLSWLSWDPDAYRATRSAYSVSPAYWMVDCVRKAVSCRGAIATPRRDVVTFCLFALPVVDFCELRNLFWCHSGGELTQFIPKGIYVRVELGHEYDLSMTGSDPAG